VRTLRVKSLPLKDVISNLAEELGVDFKEDCQVFFLKIPSDWGKGSIRGINFSVGLGVIYYACEFNSDVVIQFDVNDVHPAKFIYCKSGYLRHRFVDQKVANELDVFQSAIVASKGISGHRIHFKENIPTEVVSLEINRSLFKKQIACNLKSVHPDLRGLFMDEKAEKSFYYRGDYSAKLYDIMNSLSEMREVGLVRQLYLQGKAFEILTEQVKQYRDDKKDRIRQRLIRQSELYKIRACAEEIRTHLSEKIKLSELSKSVGMNENKVQAGFKLLYGSTVREFIIESRLSAARELLLTTDMSIGEIVINVGLSNGGYFSKQFRRRFGMTPGNYRSSFNPTVVES